MGNERPVDAIIWDLDGTLADTDLYVVENYVHMYRKYRPGYFPHLREILSFSGPSVKETLAKQFPNVPLDEAIAEFEGYSYKHQPSFVTLYPGEAAALKTIKAAGIRQCVFTNKKSKSAHLVIDAFPALKDNIEFIVGFDDVLRGKPYPDGIQKCLEILKTDPKRTMIIGDSNTDLCSGNAAGILTGLVTWSLKGLPQEHRDHEFDTYAEIEEFMIDGKLSKRDLSRGQ